MSTEEDSPSPMDLALQALAINYVNGAKALIHRDPEFKHLKGNMHKFVAMLVEGWVQITGDSLSKAFSKAFPGQQLSCTRLHLDVEKAVNKLHSPWPMLPDCHEVKVKDPKQNDPSTS